MRTREPVPDRRDGGDHPEREPLGQHPDSDHDLWSRPSLTIAEAARLCGVSVSTIRRHLAAGRFPTARQQPSPIPGQRGLWRIPTQDLLAAGLRPGQARLPDQEPKHEPTSGRTAGQPGDVRVGELEHALELERTRRRAAEDLAAERAHTIQTLEDALAALHAHHAAPAPNPDRATPPPAPPSDATGPARPAPRPGMLPMASKRRPARRELSQEEKAAIIGRALSRQRPPKRRWF
jgi:hypothetical protein